ncbi:TonB-dependent receptor plug domain-containing protein [Sulfidibacter corallicola]|uniref:TonB-dependent receptor plug domain-containing protein n=1 Tax=Sulfidibacter corallicola TaxID=2818388 RepID=A0A8A4TT63_SULCO|nr:TonB-dependent receptor plug domain-containing protein [Sulfidibacter corallicola]
MVVTATRRTTLLSKTPIAITAVDQEQLTTQNVADISTLNVLIPSLQIRDTGTDGQGSIEINMRGIGNSTYVETGEPNVALSVDGVYTARAQAALQMIYDVERIEVSRGPQGTLSGRNASVGAINIISKRPTFDEFDASVELEASNENGRAIRTMLNIPVDDTLAFRANYVKAERDTPYNLVRDDTVIPLGVGINPTHIENFGDPLDTTPGSPGSRDNEAFRLSAYWKPSDAFNWYVTYELYEDKAPGNPLSLLSNRIPSDRYLSPEQRAAVDGDPWTAVNSDPSRLDMTIDNFRSVMEYHMEDVFSAKYTYGHSEFEQTMIQDLDGGIDIQIVFVDEPWTNTSDGHDLTFTSAHGGPFQWTAGLYYFEEKNTRTFGVDFQPFGYVLFHQPDIYAESQAAYADFNYQINDKFNMFAGIRRTEDDRGNRGGGSYGPFTGSDACNNTNALGNENPQTLIGDLDADPTTGMNGQDCRYDDVTNQKDFAYTDWRGGFNFQINDDTMVYLSAATGHKSGLFDTRITVLRTNELVVIPLEPEENLSYEIGAKGTLMNGRFRYAVDYFYMDFKNKQEASILGFGDRFCDLNGDGDADDPGEQDAGCGAGGSFVDLDDNVFADQNEFLVLNVDGLDVQGIEFEYSLMPDPSNVLSGYFTWVDAEFREYLGSSAVDCNTRFGDGQPCPIENWEGNTPKNTPEFTLNATYSHIFSMRSGATLTPTINAYYRSEYHLTNENLEGVSAATLGLSSNESDLYSDLQDGATKLNFFLKYGTKRYDIEFFCTNVLDEDVISHERTDTGGIPTYVYESPREFGFRFRSLF